MNIDFTKLKTAEQKAKEAEQADKDKVRAKRDQLLNAFVWRIHRHRDEVDLGLEPTEPLEPLLQYVRALRDVPQQEGFPENVVFPDKPDFIK